MSRERLVLDDGHNLLVLARLEATGLKTVSGYSSAYDDKFPATLDGTISRREFKFCIDVLNQTVEDYFPCLPCFGCGYLWCITTCGISLCLSDPCTKQLSDNMELVLRRLNNREELLYRGIIWSLKRSRRKHTSWIEISQLVYE
ncbi:Golgin subfamily A member 7/ERF4 [Plasmopara halstedii]|uniref:Golgin subfamily A member 7/ERF4 n=1 Tax=Plasmopara halstedii TaxID=4781 RepID=A0A0P1AQ01_PLAHL|nr:Golgin subfamily A member 7/ERF4 [Plasmopara halstedii]CEG43162.1 Golgin subfamily A member 7/ERF4 [Plasmopara halstedii]|eukprot:XP_024579531.1 Golgin subfamily A member 7/ERF4 [Plasmopara halstedii]